MCGDCILISTMLSAGLVLLWLLWSHVITVTVIHDYPHHHITSNLGNAWIVGCFSGSNLLFPGPPSSELMILSPFSPPQHHHGDPIMAAASVITPAVMLSPLLATLKNHLQQLAHSPHHHDHPPVTTSLCPPFTRHHE